MKRYLYIFLFFLIFSEPSQICCEEPVLVRLAFRLPPEAMPEFAQMYEDEVVPLLNEMGLVLSQGPSRPTLPDRFSRLVEVPSSDIVIVVAGPGKGHWRSFDRTDGLASGSVQTIVQDRKGDVAEQIR